MMRPMIVMTTSISTSVNPPSPSRPTGPPRNNRRMPSISSSPMDLSDDLIDRQQGCHHRDDKTPDYHAYDDDRDRADDPDQPVEAPLQLGVVEVGDAAGQHRQLP